MRLFPYAAGLLAAASVFALASPAGAAPRSPMKIERIWYDSPGPDYRSNDSLNGEYVVLRNTSRHRAVRLDGWTLTDADRHRYIFERGVVIQPGRAVLVKTGQGRDTSSVKFQNRRAYVWDNISDTATLRDSRGMRVATCSYDNRRADYKNC